MALWSHSPPQETTASPELQQRDMDIELMRHIEDIRSSGRDLSPLEGKASNMTDAFKAILRCRAISDGLVGLEESLRIPSLPSDCSLTFPGSVKCPWRNLDGPRLWLVDNDQHVQHFAGVPLAEAKWQSLTKPTTWPPVLGNFPEELARELGNTPVPDDVIGMVKIGFENIPSEGKSTQKATKKATWALYTLIVREDSSFGVKHEPYLSKPTAANKRNRQKFLLHDDRQPRLLHAYWATGRITVEQPGDDGGGCTAATVDVPVSVAVNAALCNARLAATVASSGATTAGQPVAVHASDGGDVDDGGATAGSALPPLLLPGPPADAVASVKRYLNVDDPAEKRRRMEVVSQRWNVHARIMKEVSDVLLAAARPGAGGAAANEVIPPDDSAHRGAESALLISDSSDWDAKMNSLERCEIPTRDDIKLLDSLRRWLDLGKRMLIVTADTSGVLNLKEEVDDIITALPKSSVFIELVVLHDASIAKLLDVMSSTASDEGFDFVMFSGKGQSSSSGGRGSSVLVPLNSWLTLLDLSRLSFQTDEISSFEAILMSIVKK